MDHKVRTGILRDKKLYREYNPKKLTERTRPFSSFFLGKVLGIKQSTLSDRIRGNSQESGDKDMNSKVFESPD